METTLEDNIAKANDWVMKHNSLMVEALRGYNVTPRKLIVPMLLSSVETTTDDLGSLRPHVKRILSSNARVIEAARTAYGAAQTEQIYRAERAASAKDRASYETQITNELLAKIVRMTATHVISFHTSVDRLASDFDSDCDATVAVAFSCLQELITDTVLAVANATSELELETSKKYIDDKACAKFFYNLSRDAMITAYICINAGLAVDESTERLKEQIPSAWQNFASKLAALASSFGDLIWMSGAVL